jgi:2C-methyl-D-erythritol 2,4-cyclodiphosphate synthase
MVDMASVSAAITSLKVATDIAKFFKDTDVSFEKAETKLKLAELISALADAKMQFAEIRQVLIDKDAELRAVKGQLDVKEKLKWESPYYWIIDGDNKDGPYCQCCYDKAIH